MKKIFLLVACTAALAGCKQSNKPDYANADKKFALMCESYYQDGLKLNPIGATFIGDERYNDLLPNDGSQNNTVDFNDRIVPY